MEYLILGNSAAAVSAVDAIRSVDADGPITMVSPEEGVAYGTPLISYVLQGKTDEAHAFIRDQKWYRAQDVTCMFGLGKAAVNLDADKKSVTLEDGTELSYGKLLVATGSNPSMPDVKGLEADAPNSFTFNTMGDTHAIMAYLDSEVVASKRKASEPVNVVISGSGLIGTKCAEGVCGRVDNTYLVGHAARPLRKLLDDEASAMLVEVLERHGIINVPGTVVDAVETDADGCITAVTLSDGRTLPCDLLITAIGVRPNVGMLEAAGAEVVRGAVCDEHMRTSLVDVYAAGDVANTHNTLLAEDAPLALWPTASDQGRIAGLAMAGDEDAVYEGSFARNAVGFFGELNILGCGIINPGAETPDVESTIQNDGDSYSKFSTRDGKLVGYLLMNRPDGAGVYTAIINHGVPLSELPDGMFERTPEMRDLPKSLRTHIMLKGYTQERSA